MVDDYESAREKMRSYLRVETPHRTEEEIEEAATGLLIDRGFKTEEQKFYYLTKKEEAKDWGIDGCACSKCITIKIMREWHKSQKDNGYNNFNEYIKETKDSIKIKDIAERRYNLAIRQNKTACIFHEDNDPSMVFYEETNTFHCFGCGMSGDVIDFVERMESNAPKETIILRGIERPKFTPNERYNALKKQNWKCAECGVRLKYSKNHSLGEEVAHLDHVHPYSKRNTYINGAKNINELANIRALCGKCNLKKHDKH